MNICPGNLLSRNSNNEVVLDYPKDCWGCTSCIKECPLNAIEFFLGADIGGNGTITTATVEEGKISWNFEKPNGEKVLINIDSNKANEY